MTPDFLIFGSVGKGQYNIFFSWPHFVKLNISMSSLVLGCLGQSTKHVLDSLNNAEVVQLAHKNLQPNDMPTILVYTLFLINNKLFNAWAILSIRLFS